ncbi:MAG TPA: ribosome small subunit-dependent GTPase A [Candidatus Limnocylindria bacterium]|nr:ribosome small subunit-dependent GTPase A [Candidatus Limnocylindria bacterium]
MSTTAGLVLRARSGFYTIRTDEGDLLEARLRGRVKKERQSSDLAVIGDRVVVERLPDGTGAIESVEPRRRKFSRRQPGPRGQWREDVMVANPDLVVPVFAVDRPPPNPRLIDRFLVVAEYNEVPVLLVANKVDLVEADAARATFEPYRRIGYDVIYASAKQGIGIDELRERIAGQLSIVTGPSGVGKSTLLNALQPGLLLATGEVSEALKKGRHTTTHAELLPLHHPRGGYVADTPGIRELGLWEIPPSELAWSFPEFRDHLGGCAFNDCTHVHEPRCGLRSAVDAGAVSAERYDSYVRMLTGEPAA